MPIIIILVARRCCSTAAASRCSMQRYSAAQRSILQRTAGLHATHYSTLQQHCNTPQQTEAKNKRPKKKCSTLQQTLNSRDVACPDM